MSELVELTAAQRALTLVETPTDAKVLYDQLETLSQYAQRFRLDHEKQNEIAKMKLRTARKGGELILAAPNRYQSESRRATDSLPERFTRSMSSRWQTIAKLAKDDFEEFLRETDEVTLAAALMRAGRGERDRDIRDRRARLHAQASEYIAELGDDVCRLEVGDVATWRPEGVNVVITDPPYITEDAVELHAALGEFALDVLPDGGALVILTWQPLLPEVMRVLNHPGLVYRWMAAWAYETSARTPERKPRVFDGWKPVLVYHKGHIPADATYLYDVISSPDADKDHHEWGQSPEGFMQLVRAFTEAGELVCDPFLGGGATAVAALAETRRFIGCDINEAALEITKGRLAA